MTCAGCKETNYTQVFQLTLFGDEERVCERCGEKWEEETCSIVLKVEKALENRR